MIRFKSYIEELYTIGHTRSYDAGANRAKNNKKMRDAGTDNGWLTKDDTISTKLKGGVAFEKPEQAKIGAQDMVKAFPGKHYSVYKLKGKFNNKTVKPTKHGIHVLKRNTEIIGKHQ